MILCAICNYWQHAVCFKITIEQNAPERHICNYCGDVSYINLCAYCQIFKYTTITKCCPCLCLCSELRRRHVFRLSQTPCVHPDLVLYGGKSLTLVKCWEIREAEPQLIIDWDSMQETVPWILQLYAILLWPNQVKTLYRGKVNYKHPR